MDTFQVFSPGKVKKKKQVRVDFLFAQLKAVI